MFTNKNENVKTVEILKFCSERIEKQQSNGKIQFIILFVPLLENGFKNFKIFTRIY